MATALRQCLQPIAPCDAIDYFLPVNPEVDAIKQRRPTREFFSNSVIGKASDWRHEQGQIGEQPSLPQVLPNRNPSRT